MQNAELKAAGSDAVQIAQGLNQVKHLFNTLTAQNVDDIRAVYTQETVFIDPFVELHGVDDLVSHLASQYANLSSCKFEYGEQLIQANRASLCWLMTVKHPSLANNKEISIDGITFFEFDEDRVAFQRDYYDAGAMLYEHVPLIGSIIRMIRKRLQ